MEKEIEIKSEIEQISEEFRNVWEHIERILSSQEAMRRQLDIVIRNFDKFSRLQDILNDRTKEHIKQIRELERKIK